MKHRGAVIKWSRPAEIVPGFTRAVLIVQPAAVATVDQSETPADVVLIPMNAAQRTFAPGWQWGGFG